MVATSRTIQSNSGIRYPTAMCEQRAALLQAGRTHLGSHIKHGISERQQMLTLKLSEKIRNTELSLDFVLEFTIKHPCLMTEKQLQFSLFTLSESKFSQASVVGKWLYSLASKILTKNNNNIFLKNS